jgi:hypothetical protein
LANIQGKGFANIAEKVEILNSIIISLTKFFGGAAV